MSLALLLYLILNSLADEPLRAQTTVPTEVPNPVLPTPPPPPTSPLLPPPEELFQLPPPGQSPAQNPLNISGTVIVDRFEIVGSTIFSPEILAATTAQFTRRPLTFAELLQAASAITKLYTDKGYLTSGAFIPVNQTFQAKGGIVRIQVLEGSLDEIQVSGTQRLNPGYVQSRLAVATAPPVNVNRLLEALQILQLDPLISNISAELSAGSGPGKSVLSVVVAEADSLRSELRFDNNRSPSVGSERRQVQLSEGNLLGLGDGLTISYANTDGSDVLDASYTIPVSPHNTTLRFSYNSTSSEVIEEPFNVLDITAAARSYELSLRQPIIQTPAQEIVLGVGITRRESETALLDIPFALSAGADFQGRTRLTALRFFQELTQRSSQDVFALRSQFSVGVDLFGTTINSAAPDSRFFTWRGQAQYVRLLAPDTLLLLRTDLQLADRPLVPLEQFGLGGQESVRGYRQDFLLSDNGLFASGELRLPVLRIPEVEGILQIAPFIDFGSAWNSYGRTATDPSTLLSGGLGLLWRQSDYLSARLDWGIPLISIPSSRRTWQENGLYFSIIFSPF